VDEGVVLWTLLAVGTVVAIPASIIVLFWRQRKLRQQLTNLGRLYSQQNDALHRELLELKRQFENVAHPTPAVGEKEPIASPSVGEKVVVPVSVERPAPTEKPTPPEKPAPAFAPKLPPPVQPQVTTVPIAAVSIEANPEVTATQGPARFCAWCGTVH
jgi:hypothetical protein